MNKKNAILTSFLNISDFMNFVDSPELILGLIIEECLLLTRSQWGIILSYDDNLNIYSCQITKSLSEDKKAGLSAALDKAVKGLVASKAEDAIIKESFWANRDVKGLFKGCLGKGIDDLLINPIKKKKAFLGLAIVVDKKSGLNFTKSDKDNFGMMCQEASIVIDNINLFKAKIQNERMAAVGQTITGISHYIKNVLQGISTGSYLLNTGIKANDLKTIEESWSVVDKNAKRISDLVLDMLYYSKERKAQKENCDPKALIQDVAELMKPQLDDKKIELKVSLGDMPGYVKINEKGIHRSILNMISNAMDACTKPDSSISIEGYLDRPTQRLAIIIRDNGKGMPAEEAAKIFQPFYSTKKGKGTGLGLAITKKVVEEHGGSIKCSSEPGKGTTFEILLPASI
ncbi:MAG: GAF domain-containing sensor histidine kinase [Candidatus Omnitrophica bacterium]|nr:GAF domain-containing sensor histidine kinase [Candidatus Omnitrophota bacterium]